MMRSRAIPEGVKPLSNHQTYKIKLGEMTTGVSSLEKMLGDKHQTIEDRIMSYNVVLKNLSQACDDMTNRYDNLQQELVNNDIKDSASEVKQLCDDLSLVLEHARLITEATDDYLLINTGEWPAVSSATFNIRLDSMLITTVKSLQDLEKISVPRVNDPGVKEQVILLQQTEALIKSVGEAIAASNHTEADNLKDTLLATSTRHKDNLWDARNYYWSNTVQLKALEKKLRELEARF